MASKKATPRRKVKARGLVVNVLPEGVNLGTRADHLARLTSNELKELCRAAGIGIPKKKEEMVERLADCALAVISVTTEVVVFDRPKSNP